MCPFAVSGNSRLLMGLAAEISARNSACCSVWKGECMPDSAWCGAAGGASEWGIGAAGGASALRHAVPRLPAGASSCLLSVLGMGALCMLTPASHDLFMGCYHALPMQYFAAALAPEQADWEAVQLATPNFCPRQCAAACASLRLSIIACEPWVHLESLMIPEALAL